MQKAEIKNNIISKSIYVHREMSSSYLSYAMSVIVSRALPDVRDGLKPVHRRIIYAMYKGGYDWARPFRKSARIVGDVIGKYHPHGDQAVYDALVRLVQEFSMSLPLIEGQGNFGSIDGDPPAAMRYTETKLSKVAQFLTEGLEKNTIDYRNNYDDTEREPTVLPSQYPNLLVNGAGGIAVGMATSIPPHNLGEVIDGTINYIKNKDITISQLMKIIPGPDFPTGGVIIGKDIIKQGYNKGRGSFKIRGEIDEEPLKNGKTRLIIKSIPYQVNKSVLNEKIAELSRDKKIEGVSDIRDESNRDGIRVVVDLRRGVEPETVRRQLYKLTSIESSFGFNTLAIVDGKPKVLNLKEFISEFVDFREKTVIRRIKFDLKKTEERAHVLIGIATAVENIDPIIKIIKSSKDTETAKKNLLNKKWSIKKSSKLVKLIEKKQSVSKYQLTEIQVNSILDLKLQKLTAYGINEIETEIKKLSELIIYFNKILKSKKDLLALIINELEEIKSKFSVKRRTKIIDAVLNYSIEETIQKESVVINITNQGYIKRGSLSSVKSQKRGGKGKTGITTREEDFVIRILSGNSHSQVLFFSSQGLAYKLKAWKIPKGSLNSKGKSLFNLLPLKSNQSITSTMLLPENEDEWKNLFVVFATLKGKIRKNSLIDFLNINASGKIAMKLDDNDKIIGVEKCTESQDIMLGTRFGKCIRFMSKKLRLFKGRSSKGIRGIDLAPDDNVMSLSVVDNVKEAQSAVKKNGAKKEFIDKYILSITENGYGKRTSFLDFRVTNRGGKGIIGIINSKRNGNVTSTLIVSQSDEIILSTDKGRVIRCAVKEIRVAGRNTQGVRIIKLSGEEKVVSAIKIEDNIS
ncbi:MAG: DNA gyrase subunit A [Candidatus Pelagibacter sp.]|nr:DNA gyrase subunit A [Candidatus Pelagibacter sp.]|tara:strand:- start:2271 stop:4844 length:2574 start_codon:yes stop_codon:yes gene_type:complete